MQSKSEIENTTSLPNRPALYLVPFASSFAIALCGLLIYVHCTELGHISLIKLNARLLLLGATSLFLVSAYYDFLIKREAKKLFWQKNDKTSTKILFPQVDSARDVSLRRWMGYEWDWLHEGEGGNVPPWLGRTIVGSFKNLFFFFAFCGFMSIPLVMQPSSYLSLDVVKALLLVAATYAAAISQGRTMENLKDTYRFVAQNSNLHYLLKNKPVI